eukprot:TRINITY_DN28111_c0_g1_i1.p1 TRINITY_DN28111_c0_g1~~TRINITY_DN28111_c0_g1_i1.p1  ORF type:complete len:550 (-),score=165.46 TRINITY_DN28111_c0_g1_i1:92-1741(-)
MSTPSETTSAAPAMTSIVPAPVQAAQNSSLYVGDLKMEVTEPHLFDHFKTVGPISSIKVCRDWSTKQSLGYAYVNFETNEAAVIAINTFNHSFIMGKECRVSWCMRNPHQRNPEANIFIKNIPETMTSAELQEIFSKFGEIISCKINKDSKDANDKSAARAYVQFKDIDSAKKAIEVLNGKDMSGNIITVAKFVSRKERSKEFTNLFVKNLPESIDEKSFAEMFSAFGKVTSLLIGRNKADNVPRFKEHEDGTKTCYGFVNFENHADAQKAIEQMNEKEINGKALFVSQYKSKFERQSKNKQQVNNGTNLYTKYFPDDFTDDDLRKLFSPFGQITSVKIARKAEDQTSAGYGFVNFSTADEAQRAIGGLNNKPIRDKPLYVSLFQNKETRAAINASRKMQMIQQMNYRYMQQPFANQFPKRQYSNPKYQQRQQPYANNKPAGNQRITRPQQQQVVVAPKAPEIQPIDQAQFKTMSNQDQREALGESIYGYIDEHHSDVNAGKITGMVLESTQGNFEALNELLRNGGILGKINEAIAVFKEHVQAAPQQQ